MATEIDGGRIRVNAVRVQHIDWSVSRPNDATFVFDLVEGKSGLVFGSTRVVGTGFFSKETEAAANKLKELLEQDVVRILSVDGKSSPTAGKGNKLHEPVSPFGAPDGDLDVGQF
jgi:hypothetical protein